MLLQGCQKGYLYAVYALIYEVTVQDDAWDKKDVEPEEMWFGVFFYQNKNILHRCRSPPLKFGNLLISNFGGIRGKRLRYLEKQQKILFAEENLEDKEYTDADISPEERLELEQKEQLLMEEAQGIYPEWNEMTDISLIEAMFSLQEEERKLIYQHVFEERTFKEMSILNQMTEERCKGAYYWAIRKIRKRMGGKKS